jgi:hypothetical protein
MPTRDGLLMTEAVCDDGIVGVVVENIPSCCAGREYLRFARPLYPSPVTSILSQLLCSTDTPIDFEYTFNHVWPFRETQDPSDGRV